MLKSVIPPPGAVSESCIEFTAPVDVPVVAAANSALDASPKRTSLPSIAAPAAWGADPGPASSAQVSSAIEAPSRIAITAATAYPCRRSRTIRPKANAMANGMSRIR